MNRLGPSGATKRLDFQAINAAILRSPETVLRELYPKGRREGRNFRMGSINGEEGSSLAVCLSGPKAGVWSDFATGDRGGDIIRLLAVSEGCKQSVAARKLADMLGVE